MNMFEKMSLIFACVLPLSWSAPTVEGAAAVKKPAAVAITPVDVPAGFGYPGNRSEFQAWADSWSIGNITTAAWNLWAGMTSPSGQTWNGGNLPVWETWCGNEEVFSGAGCKSMRRPSRGYQRPRQIGHTALRTGMQAKSDTRVVSFNKFNPPMADFLARQHPGPGGASYNYVFMQSLAALNAAWPAQTPISARKIAETPYQPDKGYTKGLAAMETKPVIFLVKASQNLPQGQALTPIPLWQGPAQSTTPANATPETWRTCVLLDPNGSSDPSTAPTQATRTQIGQLVPSPGLSCSKYFYAPLATIYSFQMDAADAVAWNNNNADGSQLEAAAGDYGVLVGMHVNSKAIVNWTWQTFWWQPGGDTPNNFPGSKQGMTNNVAGAWRNYASCTAWHQTKGTRSQDMVVCFNPYLETSAGIPDGQASNCMSCHGTATVGSPLVPGTPPGTPPSLLTLDYPAAYTQPIDFNTDPRYSTFTRTDFSWAIPSNALPPPRK